MADKRIIELEERLTLSDGDYFATDNTNGTCKVNAKILLDRFDDDEDDIATRAKKVDLTNISTTGSTNNSGATITSGTYFYKDGTLARAKTDIANGATLTLNTNYEIVTAGGLNSLNEALSDKLNFTYTPLLEVSSTGTSISIAQNINNFKLVALMFKTAGDVYINYAMIPVAAFKTGGIQVEYYDSSRHYAVVKYKTNTTVDTQFSGGTVLGEFYGVN